VISVFILKCLNIKIVNKDVTPRGNLTGMRFRVALYEFMNISEEHIFSISCPRDEPAGSFETTED
jgi:hypothetical protein